MYYVKNVRFKVPHTDEEIYFEDGDVKGLYDIVNWQVDSEGEISYVTVGRYNGSAAPEHRMTIMNNSIVWNNEITEVSNMSSKTELGTLPDYDRGHMHACLCKSVCVCVCFAASSFSVQ